MALVKVDLLEQMEDKREYKACFSASVQKPVIEAILNTFCCSV